MKKNKSIAALSRFFMLAAFGIFLLPACDKTRSETAQEATDEEPAPEAEASAVTITKEQFASLGIQFGNIEQKNLSSVLKATGNLRVPPQNKANITSILGGTVRQILVKEGDRVRAGQTLLTLVNPAFVKMQEEYLDATAQLAYAEADYARQKELSDKNVAAQKTFQQAESNYKSLKAKSGSLKNQLNLVGIKAENLTSENISAVISVPSPIAGNVSEISVNIGATADATTYLMDIIDNSHLHLDVYMFEQDLPKIKNNQVIDFSLTNLPGKNYTAKIFSIGSAFEGESKTVPIHAEITGDKSGLIEGMNVTAGVNIGNNLTSAVLSNAIISHAGNDYVFIQSAGKEFSFQKIQVKKGVSDGNFTEITPLQEVPGHAKVVTNGAFYLMAMLTNVGEEE